MSKVIHVKDRLAFKTSSRVITDEGYMKAPAVVARTGIQEYLSSELGMDGAERVIKVYRAPEEVFAHDSLESFDNQTITIDHPTELVDANSFKTVAAGHMISSGRREGETVMADLLIKDKAAIDAIMSGKVEVSCGYTAEYDWTPGITPDGVSYDAQQRNIRINHLALVDRGRAGIARILDRKPKEADNMHHVICDGKRISLDDESKAQLLQSTIDGLADRVKVAEQKVKDAEAKADEMEAAKDSAEEEMAKEKEKTSDAAISARVAEVVDTRASAAKLAGKEFSCDSCDPMTIKRAAMAAKRPSMDWDAKSDAYVAAAFDMAQEAMEQEDEEAEEKAKKTGDSHKALGAAIESGQSVNDAQATRDASYEAFLAKRYNKEAK